MHALIPIRIVNRLRWLRVRRGLVVGVAMAAASGIVAPAAAVAAPYDNTDPASTGCASSAYTVTSRTIYDSRGGRLALLELRWSTSCQTNWTRMSSLQGTRWMRAYIDRRSPLARLDFAGTYSSLYTNQLYGGSGTSCLYSSGWVRDPYTGYMNYGETGCY